MSVQRPKGSVLKRRVPMIWCGSWGMDVISCRIAERRSRERSRESSLILPVVRSWSLSSVDRRVLFPLRKESLIRKNGCQSLL